MKEEDLASLNQLTKTLEDSYEKLSKAYEKKDVETFNKLKSIIIRIQRKISQIAQ